MRAGLDKATHGPTGEDQHPTPNNSTPDPDSPFLPSRGPRSPSTGVRALPPPVGFSSVRGPHQTCPSRHRSLEKGAPRGFSLSVASIARKEGGGHERWEGRVQGHVTHSQLKTQASALSPAHAQARSVGEEHSFPFFMAVLGLCCCTWAFSSCKALLIGRHSHVQSSCTGLNPRPLGLNP